MREAEVCARARAHTGAHTSFGGRNVIVAFQQFITIYVNEYRCIDDDVASATKVLGPRAC